ncbi:MAG TPA: methylenetetrahydrofolate reductase [NAD(P)H] [Clostridiales bacterium]|jgi:methylenetetrahydrofolate reductase (NADPH)|nr:methylenetetrahydrofolate reductase [NAD(P)H] [Clostridiales bacterium]HCG35294.1 methylenetetrahydrofolate reductase [NAD(P)H] [Clostridiales bacterium]
MRISSMFKKDRPLYSFELFPPKPNSPIKTIYETLEAIADLNPAYISVTYGAGGNPADNSTFDIACLLQEKYHITPLPHITCITSSKDEINNRLAKYQDAGIENIFALRGDENPHIAAKDDFRYASELITYIKGRFNFDITGACYPEGHIASPSLEQDIQYLKRKVDAGASHLISQLFFSNEHFFDFVERCRAVGIHLPIEAGIMPVVNVKQIQKMVTLCGASLPRKLTRMMQKYEDNPAALRDAGIAYATDQIVELLAAGVDGIHLYTMNNPYVARRITENIAGIIK